MKTCLLFFLIFASSHLARTEAADVKFLGHDGEKEQVQSYNLNSIAKALPALYENLIKTNSSSFEDKVTGLEGFKLGKRTLYVGAAIGAQVGLGPIIKLEAVPSFYLIFEKQAFTQHQH